MKLPTYHQLDAMDCGPTCLRMVAKQYGLSLLAQELSEAADIGKDGVKYARYCTRCAKAIAFVRAKCGF